MTILLLIFAFVAVALIVVFGARARAATQAPADATPIADPTTLASQAQVEEAIRGLLRRRIDGTRPEGLVAAGVDDDHVGYTGSVMVGERDRRKIDLFAPGFPPDEPDLASLLDRLRELSRNEPRGPIYHVNIHVRPDGAIDFEYFHENTPFASIDEVPRYSFNLPSFVFRNRFDHAMVDELSDSDVDDGLTVHVMHLLGDGRPAPPVMLELFATADWESDVKNGGLDQFFARDHSWQGGTPRADLYPRVLAGLRRIGADELAALFAESIALWAHFQPSVETARVQLGIPAVPRQEQSDIGGRFYDHADRLRTQRTAYLRAHPDAFARPTPAFPAGR